MARARVSNPGPSARYYAKNPEARAKKNAYQRKYNKKPGQSKRRSELNIARRKAGIYGKGGPDMSHDSKGNLKKQSVKINRANNGHGNRPRYRSA